MGRFGANVKLGHRTKVFTQMIPMAVPVAIIPGAMEHEKKVLETTNELHLLSLHETGSLNLTGSIAYICLSWKLRCQLPQCHSPEDQTLASAQASEATQFTNHVQPPPTPNCRDFDRQKPS